jgi:DNA-binding transcriptional MerR regulator
LLLKVGDLARSNHLTVRTLHHYDAIGLLKPSARSESGYRLYNREDVARLQAILALRELGLPLPDIATVFAQNGSNVHGILAQQIQAVRRHVEASNALLAQLDLLQSQFAAGEPPPASEWLATLARMKTWGEYFNASELKFILHQRNNAKKRWDSLFADVRTAMNDGMAADSLPAQALAQRWVALMFDWMAGDSDMVQRWGAMYRVEPAAYENQDPSPQMVAFITVAIDLRKAALLRHMRADELTQIRPLSSAQWKALATAIQKIDQQPKASIDKATRSVLRKWARMALAQVGQNRELLSKLLAAISSEPLLQYATGDELVVRGFLRQALPTHGMPFNIKADPD